MLPKRNRLGLSAWVSGQVEPVKSEIPLNIAPLALATRNHSLTIAAVR